MEEFESEEGKALLAKLGITGDYEGIGHCVVGHIKGDYPAQGERIDYKRFTFEVQEASQRRIVRVKVIVHNND